MNISDRERIFLSKLAKLLADYDAAITTVEGKDNVEILFGEQPLIQRHYVDADDINKTVAESKTTAVIPPPPPPPIPPQLQFSREDFRDPLPHLPEECRTKR